MNEEYLFNINNELVKYVNNQVKNFINKNIDDSIIYNYNRMTIEEIAQECLLKIVRSNNGNINKSYVNKIVRHVCIDLYRKPVDVDIDHFKASDDEGNIDLEDLMESSISEEEAFEEIIIENEIKDYEPLFKSIITLRLKGFSNVEIKDILDIPHDTYYRILRKIKNI